MHFLLSHWQFEGRAGIRPSPSHPGKGLLHILPFRSLFCSVPYSKVIAAWSVWAPCFYLQALERCLCHCLLFLFFLQRNPTVLWSRAPDSWVTFRICPIWQDYVAHADRMTTCSRFLQLYSTFAESFMFQEAFDCPILSILDIFLLIPTMCSLLNRSEPKVSDVPKVLLYALSIWSAVSVQ